MDLSELLKLLGVGKISLYGINEFHWYTINKYSVNEKTMFLKSSVDSIYSSLLEDSILITLS